MFARHASLRLDSAMTPGSEISPYYDSMIAKVIAHDTTRDAARERLAAALDTFVAFGVITNQALLARVLRDEDFAKGRHTTTYLAQHRVRLAAVHSMAMVAAVAGVLLCLHRARVASYGEWTLWSNASGHRTRVALQAGGESHELSVQRNATGYAVLHAPSSTSRLATPTPETSVATGESAPLVLRVLEDDGGRARVLLEGSGSPARIVYHCTDSTIALALNGDVVHFSERVHVGRSRSGDGALDGRVLAPMTGRVVAVHVEAGARVAKGSPLVSLSAMKMEHVIAAPAAATVSTVHVQVDEQVRVGQLLAQLEV